MSYMEWSVWVFVMGFDVVLVVALMDGIVRWFRGRNKDVSKLYCQLCGSDMKRKPRKRWVCKKCESIIKKNSTCFCGGKPVEEEQERWICANCGAELLRGDPQWLINKQIDAEERAKMQGMIRGSRSQSGKARKKKIQKNPWALKDYR